MKAWRPIAAVAALLPVSALATEQRIELWLNPAVAVALDDRTLIELETAQRFRDIPASDTRYARLWLGRSVAENVTLSAGIERRYEGDGRETRMLQQASYPVGPLRARTRLEQRFLSDARRTAWRLRQRIGGALPLSGREGKWQLAASVEGFFTLRVADPWAQGGLTGVRSFVGLEREWRNLELSVGYLRQQTVRAQAPDTITHAPLVAATFTF